MQHQFTAFLLASFLSTFCLPSFANQQLQEKLKGCPETLNDADQVTPDVLDQFREKLRAKQKQKADAHKKDMVASFENPDTLTPRRVEEIKEDVRIALQEYVQANYDKIKQKDPKALAIWIKVITGEVDPAETPYQSIFLQIANISMSSSRGYLFRKGLEASSEESENLDLTLEEFFGPEVSTSGSKGLRGFISKVTPRNITFSTVADLVRELQSLNSFQRLRSLRESIENVDSLSLDEAISILQVFKGHRQYLAYRAISKKMSSQINYLPPTPLGMENPYLKWHLARMVFNKLRADVVAAELEKMPLIGLGDFLYMVNRFPEVAREIVDNRHLYKFDFDFDNYLKNHLKNNTILNAAFEYLSLQYGYWRGRKVYDIYYRQKGYHIVPEVQDAYPIPRSKEFSMRRFWQSTKRVVGAAVLGSAAAVGAATMVVNSNPESLLSPKKTILKMRYGSGDPQTTSELNDLLTITSGIYYSDSSKAQFIQEFFTKHFKKLRFEEVKTINDIVPDNNQTIIQGWLRGNNYKIPFKDFQALLEKTAFRPGDTNKSTVREAVEGYFRHNPDKADIETFIRWYTEKNPYYDQSIVDHLRKLKNATRIVNQSDLENIFRAAGKASNHASQDKILIDFYHTYESQLSLIDVAQISERAKLAESSYEILMSYLRFHHFEINVDDFKTLLKTVDGGIKWYSSSGFKDQRDNLVQWYLKYHPGVHEAVKLELMRK